MSKVLPFIWDADEMNQLLELVREFNEKFDRAHERMAKDDAKIARLKEESLAYREEMNDLKAKTQASIAEMNAILEQMRAM